jgi:hypothetical protein
MIPSDIINTVNRKSVNAFSFVCVRGSPLTWGRGTEAGREGGGRRQIVSIIIIMMPKLHIEFSSLPFIDTIGITYLAGSPPYYHFWKLL